MLNERILFFLLFLRETESVIKYTPSLFLGYDALKTLLINPCHIQTFCTTVVVSIYSYHHTPVKMHYIDGSMNYFKRLCRRQSDRLKNRIGIYYNFVHSINYFKTILLPHYTVRIIILSKLIYT